MESSWFQNALDGSGGKAQVSLTRVMSERLSCGCMPLISALTLPLVDAMVRAFVESSKHQTQLTDRI